MRASGLAGVLAASLVLAGCSNDADGDPAPSLAPVTPSSSASPSATAGGGATDVPAEAQAATPEGAAAFVRYFFDQVERAYAASDPSLVRPLLDPACSSCQAAVESLQRLQSEEITVEGYTLDVADVAAPAITGQESSVSVTVTLESSEYVETSASGDILRTADASQVVQDLTLSRVGEGWLVRDVRTA